MTDQHYEIADFKNEADALEDIRKLEQKLSERYGSDVVLIAYAADND